MTTFKDDLFSYVKHVNLLNLEFLSTIPQPSKEVQDMIYQLAFLDMYGTQLQYPKVDLAKKDITTTEAAVDQAQLTRYKQKLSGLQTTFKNPDSPLSTMIKNLAQNVQESEISEFYRYLTGKLMELPIQSSNPKLAKEIATINAYLANYEPKQPQQQNNLTAIIIVLLVIIMFFLYITLLKPYLKKKAKEEDPESDVDD